MDMVVFIIVRKEMGLPATLLLGFCSEGDNRPDAAKLVRYFDEWQDQVRERVIFGRK